MNAYIGSLRDDRSLEQMKRKCEGLASDAELEKLKKAFKGNDSFSNFIQSLILTGAQQTHLRKHLVKSAMVQKLH